MNQKSGTSNDAADKLVKGIKRKTRKQYSAEEKIRIVLAGLRGEENEPFVRHWFEHNGECRAVPPRGDQRKHLRHVVEAARTSSRRPCATSASTTASSGNPS
jgi:hypothetical protein